jgi:hypothetical protein
MYKEEVWISNRRGLQTRSFTQIIWRARHSPLEWLDCGVIDMPAELPQKSYIRYQSLTLVHNVPICRIDLQPRCFIIGRGGFPICRGVGFHVPMMYNRVLHRSFWRVSITADERFMDWFRNSSRVGPVGRGVLAMADVDGTLLFFGEFQDAPQSESGVSTTRLPTLFHSLRQRRIHYRIGNSS